MIMLMGTISTGPPTRLTMRVGVASLVFVLRKREVGRKNK